MPIYIVLVNDPHTDTQPFAYQDPEKALAFAKVQAEELGCTVENPVQGDFLLYMSHEEESYWVFVKQAELQ